MMYELLRAKNGYVGEQAIRFARELVRTPSVSLHEGQVAELVEQQMRAIGYDSVSRDKAGNVIGIMHGLVRGPVLLLNSHLDTVPEESDGAQPGSPPCGTVRRGVLHGRGAADCKAGLAAQVFVGDLLRRSLLPLNGCLVVAATVAEENGCGVGVRELIKDTLPRMDLRPAYAVLGEPTGLNVYYGHDGWLELEVCVEGSNPFEVDDAAKAITGEFDVWRDDEGAEEISIGSTRFENQTGLRRALIPVDRRVSRTDACEKVLQDVRKQSLRMAQAFGNVAVEVAVRQESQRLYNGTTTLVRRVCNAWETDPFSPLLQRASQSLTAAGCQFKPGKWKLGRLGMGTAGSVLQKEFHVPTVGYGPGLEDLAHAPNEHVEIASIQEAVYGTTVIVHSLIGVPTFGWGADEI
jgi:acetylornithine deacetylase/succinyl-diaminopimelate desuccinylase-like protein